MKTTIGPMLCKLNTEHATIPELAERRAAAEAEQRREAEAAARAAAERETAARKAAEEAQRRAAEREAAARRQREAEQRAAAERERKMREAQKAAARSRRNKALAIGGIVLAGLLVTLGRALNLFDVIKNEGKVTPTPAVTMPSLPPVTLALPTTYEITNADGYAEYRLVYAEESSGKLTRIDYVYYLSKASGKYLTKAEYEALTDEEWDEIMPGFSTYDFASVEVSETDEYVRITIKMERLDQSRNLQQLAEYGLIEWEGGEGDFADAETFKQSLLDQGAAEGFFLGFQ